MRPTFGPRVPRTSFLTSVCLTAAALLLASGAPAGAQTTGTITGRITDSRSSQPVAGATIEIVGTRLGVTSSDDGRYRITNVPLGAQTITARRIGYAVLRKPVTVAEGEATVDFALQGSVVSLDEVVVTGTAGREQLRAIGNSVSTVNAPEVLQQSAAPNLGSLLAARTPGVVLSTGSGRIGAGPAINIRGRSSIGLGNSPLIYIDGVRVNNTTSTGTSGNQGFSQQGAQVAGRLNDIIPEDIERIEIIKGPAASTIYGTEASNGVIQIITKKGASGNRPSLSMQVQEGSAFFRDAEDRMPTNYIKTSAGDIVPWNAVKQERQRGTPMFRTGETRLINGSVSGNRNDMRYYFSAAFNDEKGIEPNNSLKQLSTHANLGVTLSPQLDLTTSLNYVDLRSHLGTDYGASAMYGATFGHANLYPGSRGFAAGFAPEISQQFWDNSQDVNRMTASSTLSHTPIDWFRQRLIVGVDYTGDDSRGLERFIPAPLSAMAPSAAPGRIGQTLRRNTGITGDYAGTASVVIRPELTAATSIGGQFYRNEQTSSFLGGVGFPAPGIETVSGAAVPLASTQSDQINTTLGVFAQEKFSWRERLFLTGAVRVDNNSAFGDDLKWVTYPKFDAAWVVSEEPFFHWTNVLSALRLRAAYGESGRQPSTFSALRTFLAIQGPNNANGVTPGNIGNADLRPERGKELEAGFEAALFDRVNFDFTYFNKKTTDLIVDQAIAPSTGFPGTRPMNLGRVDNKGMELAATAKVLERANFAWDLSATLATNKDVIKDLGGLPSTVTSFGQKNVVGYPINGIFTKRVVSASVDATTGVVSNVLCDPGNGGAGVACATAPFLFIGTPTPKATGAIANTISLGKSLRFYGLVDFKRGHKVYNTNELLRCSGLAGAPFCDLSYHPQNYSVQRVAEASGTAFTQGYVDQYFQDGSFLKLREISMTYTLPQRLTMKAQSASITIAGRELHTWTDYRGLDPEANSSSVAGATTLDQANIPPLTRFTVSLNVRF